jgi:transcriptional regulator GlxA family with amidase domain
MTQTRFVFLLLPGVHLMDLAGPEQAVLEAIDFGADFEILHCGTQPALQTSAGLPLRPSCHFSDVVCGAGDYLVIPGVRVAYLASAEFRREDALFAWLCAAHQRGARLVSVCTGAFVLGWAGLLNGIPCTTHFQQIGHLQRLFPTAKVQENRLFTEHGRILTSAGIASGIDLALHLIEQLKGPHLAHRVAREMVVYTRRTGEHRQQGDLMAYRNHLHEGVHRAQDYVVEHLDGDTSLATLAGLANMSERNFTRIFRRETGMSVVEYLNFLRRARIGALMKNPDLSRRQIAEKCGLRSERHLARLLRAG